MLNNFRNDQLTCIIDCQLWAEQRADEAWNYDQHQTLEYIFLIRLSIIILSKLKQFSRTSSLPELKWLNLLIEDWRKLNPTLNLLLWAEADNDTLYQTR